MEAMCHHYGRNLSENSEIFHKMVAIRHDLDNNCDKVSLREDFCGLRVAVRNCDKTRFTHGLVLMLVEERRNRLLEVVRTRRFASLPELVQELRVSESTVRRDLEYLEDQGVTKRIHGGVLYAGTSPKIPHFDQRDPADLEDKRAIAKAAVNLIKDGESVLLDGGSTTYEVARLLAGRPLHVVTNSLPVANLLGSDSECDLVFLGGNICSRTGVAMGPLTNRMIQSLRVHKTILSVAGASEEGFFNNNLLLVETERVMLQSADEVVVVADSSKLGRRSLAHLCGLGDVSRLVVDSGIGDDWREKITGAGVDLITAGDNSKLLPKAATETIKQTHSEGMPNGDSSAH